MTLSLEPYDTVPEQPQGRLGRLIPWLVVFSLSLLFLPLYLLSASLARENVALEIEVTALGEQLERGPLISTGVQTLQDTLSETVVQISALEVARSTLLQTQIDWPAVMASIGNYNDHTMVVLSLAQADREFLVSGRAWDEPTVIAYAQRLEDSGYFVRVTVQSISTNFIPTPTPLPATASPSPSDTPEATPHPLISGASRAKYVEFTIAVQLKAVEP